MQVSLDDGTNDLIIVKSAVGRCSVLGMFLELEEGTHIDSANMNHSDSIEYVKVKTDSRLPSL